MRQQTYNRVFNAARKEQGFVSQAQLDAFFACVDHDSSAHRCPDCAKGDGHAYIDDGVQPTIGMCDVARTLYAAYVSLGD